MSNRAPAFQFYHTDWVNDPKLKLISPEAKGLLIDLICYMYGSDKIGYLFIAGNKLDLKSIQKLVGFPPKKFQKSVKELLKFGIILEHEIYGFYSPRIVRDEALREVRRESGKLGGNPNLVNQNPTPSSSSSSSISNSLANAKQDSELLENINTSEQARASNNTNSKTQTSSENSEVSSTPNQQVIAEYLAQRHQMKGRSLDSLTDEFFFRMEGENWTVNGSPVRNWQRLLDGWVRKSAERRAA